MHVSLHNLYNRENIDTLITLLSKSRALEANPSSH